MKKISLLLALFALVINTQAQSKKTKDRNAIKEMCGCFEVTFNFAETFQYSKDSLYKPSEVKIASALEWGQLVTDEKNKITIQHLLQMGPSENAYIVKHWRQDWLYENEDFYMFNGDNEWLYQQAPRKEVKKKWTQKVYQVDDSPRYEGSASWVHVDGKSYWENTTDAPLPRREYTKRNDYNVTSRGNRHEITTTGWVHDQDNAKIIRTKGAVDVILAKEKGYNTYVKVADSRCQGAADWWQKNQGKWAVVRGEWDQIYAQNKDLRLEARIGNKPLYKYLFSDDYASQEKINEIITSFVKK